MRTDLTLLVICVIWSLAFARSASAQSTPPDRATDATAIRAEKSTQKLTLIDVYNKGPNGWIQVASNTSPHPEEIDRQMSRAHSLSDSDRKALFAAREAVWRAWFAGDTAALSKLVPPELVTIEPGSETFGTHTSTLAGSGGFAAGGGQLLRLVFPRTELQAYGNMAILYTTYEMDLLAGGKPTTERGVATEVFVRRQGDWINTGWQLARTTK